MDPASHGLHASLQCNEKTNKSLKVDSLIDIVAGTSSGLTTVIVGHPLDTIKVRLQASTVYNGLSECIYQTYRIEGLKGFFKGIQSPLLGEGFFNAWQFGVWGLAKKIINFLPQNTKETNNNYDITNVRVNTQKDLSVPQFFLAGSLTGIGTSIIESPVDFMKNQLQVQIFRSEPEFRTFKQAVQTIYRQNGFFGFYQGYLATLTNAIPASGLYFGVYEGTRQVFINRANSNQNKDKSHQICTRDNLSAGPQLIAGGLGGCAYWFCSFPLDCIKSSIQGDSYKKSERKYSSIFDCARKLYKEGGIRRFYRGLSPCMIRAFPANAAGFYAYENTRSLLTKLT